MKRNWRGLIPLLVLLSLPGTSSGTHGQIVSWGLNIGRAVPLADMAGEASLIFKGTAVSSRKVDDATLTRDGIPEGYACYETEFKPLSVVKGNKPDGNLRFRHYDEDPGTRPSVVSSGPDRSHFESGRSYLVFGRKHRSGAFQQLWSDHTDMPGEGVLRCADDRPVRGATVKTIYWTELTALLGSADADDGSYAIRQLDILSGGGGIREDEGDSLLEFNRQQVVAVIHALMAGPDPKIVRQVIEVTGSHNPYFSEDSAEFWLAAVGSAPAQVVPWNPKMENVGGKLYRDEFVALAGSQADIGTRRLAVAALGLVRDPALREPILRWLGDPAEEVRAAAALLLSDFPELATRERLDALAKDPAAAVRVAAAHVVGFGQYANLTPALSKFLRDEEPLVRKAAAMSLLSFEPKAEPVTSIFRSNIDNKEFIPLFLLGLAHLKPGEYLDPLVEIMRGDLYPQANLSTPIPSWTAWEILFKYLRSLPKKDLVSGRFDRYLDVIEDADDKSSIATYNVYAFYLQRGMTGRAKNYRRKATAAGGNAEWMIAEVASDPARYTRRDEDDFYH